MSDLFPLVEMSRSQFALTALYHWLFVPLTLGLSLIIAIMETIYYRTGDEEWKRTEKFWMTLFGINFATGVATGIILEFQFGTNWSNYSWFVGDIFGAPLAIEGIMAFFMESTFIAIMFFGWNKVSKKAHLAATWLTCIGAALSALWILVANAWMQYPAGMYFNPDTVRNEMYSFSDVVLSPVATNKFFHSVTSGWVLAAVFVLSISAWYLIKNRDKALALRSSKLAALVGLAGISIVFYTGDGSAKQVAHKQPMKLAAMEGVYDGKKGQELIVFGILNPDKKSYADTTETFLFKIKIPRLLSYLATGSTEGYIPGINNIIDGGYKAEDPFTGDTTITLSARERMERGKKAVLALSQYKKAVAANDTEAAQYAEEKLQQNYDSFGYAYITDIAQLVPPVPLVFYSFHIMFTLGIYLFILFTAVLFLTYKRNYERYKPILYIVLFSLPLGYICLESGWIVAEVGRQPWVIQDIMPTYSAISDINVKSVTATFWIFAIFFTVLFIAEVGIMLNQIKKGPDPQNR